MEDIFLQEEQVIKMAEDLLNSNKIETKNDAMEYKALLDKYKKLVKQMMTLIKISDLNHSELNLLSKRFKIASGIDSLTELYNRRYFDEIFQKEWLNAIRHKLPLAVIMVDVDHFKEYNDIYGHLMGDSCLKTISKAIRNSALRSSDIVARFGGDEFIVLLPETNENGSVRVAERIIMNMEKLNINNSGSPNFRKVTVSVGVAVEFPKSDKVSSELLHMSDVALYCAKTEGRNCFRIYK